MSTRVVLDPDRVREIFTDCEGGSVVVDGVQGRVSFNADRLGHHRAEIEALLSELPDEFRKSTGDSFLRACQDKYGRLWTGEHTVVDELLMLGMGIGKFRFLLSRDLWALLPGGMPYYVLVD
ncbi:hypothetical protein HYZ98_01680 [Candidatus Peregrinibacteria bacterium]|nr:hypothetical protein [Candidatus Peregrinibacteria bacterium]